MLIGLTNDYPWAVEVEDKDVLLSLAVHDRIPVEDVVDAGQRREGALDAEDEHGEFEYGICASSSREPVDHPGSHGQLVDDLDIGEELEPRGKVLVGRGEEGVVVRGDVEVAEDLEEVQWR